MQTTGDEVAQAERMHVQGLYAADLALRMPILRLMIAGMAALGGWCLYDVSVAADLTLPERVWACVILGSLTISTCSTAIRGSSPFLREVLAGPRAVDIDVYQQPVVTEKVPFWKIRSTARLIDYSLFLCFLSFVVKRFPEWQFDVPNQRIYWSMLSFVLYIPVDSICVWLFRATPGKWLMGITINRSDGRRLSFRESVRRAVDVWAKTLGFGFMILTMFTVYLQVSTLRRFGATSYDLSHGWRVELKSMNHLRRIGYFVFLICMFGGIFLAPGRAYSFSMFDMLYCFSFTMTRLVELFQG
ncbi:MAG: RDD family protein [Planctomycetota bacterium]|nr:RDD family protein [Planctomycetota bacterium]MDA1213846.1 RDD family protein [Planctomycetota bacterium]